jgi:creatinine amidohydrolase
MTQNGCIGDATQASYELGQQIVEEALENLSKDLYSLLNINKDVYI